MALGFPVCPYSGDVVTIEPGVKFKTDTGITATFQTAKTFSMASIHHDNINLDGIAFGGYSDKAVVVNITTWNAPQQAISTFSFQYNASAIYASGVHFNITMTNPAGYVVAAQVDGASQNVYRISDTAFMLNWSSWSGPHYFNWSVTQEQFLGTDLMGMMSNAVWVFGFIMVVTLTMMGAWWMRKRRGD